MITKLLAAVWIVGSAWISFVVTMKVISGITFQERGGEWPDHALGYQGAGILTLTGLAGIAVGIKILKKKKLPGATLIAVFSVHVVLAVITFVFGPQL